MTRPRMRPVFDIPLVGDGLSVFALLSRGLADPDIDLIGQVKAPSAFIRFPEERCTLLSPHLNLQLIEEDGETILHGRFSPRPNVWTGFMALFFILGMLGLIGLVYGLAQLTLGGSPWAVWAAPVSIALIAFIYGAAFIGQGLSSEQMYELRSFVDAAVRDSGA